MQTTESRPKLAVSAAGHETVSRTGPQLIGNAIVARMRVGPAVEAMWFFASIKTEIGVEDWSDRAGARRDIENWIKSVRG